MDEIVNILLIYAVYMENIDGFVLDCIISSLTAKTREKVLQFSTESSISSLLNQDSMHFHLCFVQL